MQADAHAERYVRLGLQLGRHADDIVDTYFGPPELAAAVDAAAPVEPARLSASARALLAELDDGWLRDQVAGLGAYAGVLAGESRPYADAVEACYQLRPKRTDEAVFAGVHERLEELLPGAGTLHERYDALRRSASCRPADRAGGGRRDRGCPHLHLRAGRSPRRRGGRPRDRPRRAVDGVLPLRRRPAQPDLHQRRPAALGDRPDPARASTRPTPAITSSAA